MSATTTPASAVTAASCGNAIDIMARARSLADFLGWACSARELELARNHRDFIRPGERDDLPATMEFNNHVADGQQWAFFHLGELIDQASAELDRARATTRTD